MEENYSYEKFLESVRIGDISHIFFITYLDEYETPRISNFSDYNKTLDFYNNKTNYHEKKITFGYRVITKEHHYYFEPLIISENDLKNFSDFEVEDNLKVLASKQLADRIFGFV